MTMKRVSVSVVAVAMTLVWMAAGCGDDDGDTTQDAAVADAALSDGSAPDGQVSPDGSVTAGDASDVTVDLHVANVFSYRLSDLTAHPDYAGADWDFSVSKAMPNPPTFLLGPGVTAVNLGNTDAYHDVLEAPEAGYDDDDPDAIMGISWQDGGSGTTGFQATHNVYVLKLADGTYGKVEVLSAMGGQVVVRLYRQGDGSRNLTTTP